MDGSVSHSVLEIIQCSFSRCKGKHFLKNPVTLPCSHNVCLNCLQDVLSNVTIKEIACTYPDCTKRHEVNNLKDYKINNMVDVIIKENLNDLFSILKNSFTQIYNDFNEIDFEMKIDAHCEFIENEIDLRIESLKIQLDELSNTYHDRLKYYKQLAKDSLKVDELAVKKNEYLQLTQQEYEGSLEKFYEYEKRVMESKLEIEKFILNAPKVIFDKSHLNIRGKFIGKFNDFLSNNNPTRLVHVNSAPIPHKFLNRIAYLESKQQYLITDREDQTVKVLSSNGHYLGEYNPNLLLEYPFAIYVNNSTNEIFVGDYKLQRIVVFDENFKHITEFGHNIAKAPNTITMDKLTGLIYCTDYWYDKVSIWQGEYPDDINSNENFRCTNYILNNEFDCDSPAYIQIALDKIFIVSAIEVETEETSSKLKEIKKGSNCIFVFDKIKLEILFTIRLKDWIEPYGLVIDIYANVYTSASELDNENNISSTASLFKFDKNGRLLSKIQFSNYIPIDFYIYENKILSISTEVQPVQLLELKE